VGKTSHLISPLNHSHDVGAFACHHKPLETFLKRHALKNAANNLGRTYALTEAGSQSVVGYYTLSATGVSRGMIPGHEFLPRYDPMPALLLGRLAVDDKRRGFGYGRSLVGHAFARAWEASLLAGIYLLAVDAKDEEARAFYIHTGFVEFGDTPLHLFFPMSSIVSMLQPPMGSSQN